MQVAIVGGSDAGIEAARRCLELDPGVRVSLLVADAYPNFSICGIPYRVSGEVPDWRDLAHRGTAELEQIGKRGRAQAAGPATLPEREHARGADRNSCAPFVPKSRYRRGPYRP